MPPPPSQAFKSNITDAEAEQKRITGTQAENAKQVAEAKAAATEAGKKRQADCHHGPHGREKGSGCGRHRNRSRSAFSAGLYARIAAGVAWTAPFALWTVATGSPVDRGVLVRLRKLPPRWSPGLTVPSFLATPDGAESLCHRLRAVSGNSSAFSAATKEPELFADRVNAVAFCPDGKTLATGSV